MTFLRAMAMMVPCGFTPGAVGSRLASFIYRWLAWYIRKAGRVQCDSPGDLAFQQCFAAHGPNGREENSPRPFAKQGQGRLQKSARLEQGSVHIHAQRHLLRERRTGVTLILNHLILKSVANRERCRRLQQRVVIRSAGPPQERDA